MFSHFVIRFVECRSIPRALLVIDSRCAVVGDKHRRYAAKVIIHISMRLDPVVGLLVDECFHKSILAIRQYTNEEPGICDLTGIGIDDMCRITSPVNFDLFTRLPGDMHSCTAFLLILLDVPAEL